MCSLNQDLIHQNNGSTLSLHCPEPVEGSMYAGNKKVIIRQAQDDFFHHFHRDTLQGGQVYYDVEKTMRSTSVGRELDD